MSDFGILATGAYIPRRRLQRAAIHAPNRWFAGSLGGLAKGERSAANWDEDAITMAVEAGRDCLSGRDRALVEAVSLASTSLPFADRLNAGIAKEALNLGDTVKAADVTGSLRAATTALLDALEGRRNRLVIGSDLRKSRPASEGELVQGDGAAAILVGHGEPIAQLLSHRSETIDFVGHFRSAGKDFDYHWESRWVREEEHLGIFADAVSAMLADAGIDAQTLDHVIVPLTATATTKALVRKLGFRAEAMVDALGSTVGDTGAGHPLLMLSAALERAGPGEKILLTGIGQGADVALFETTAAIDRPRSSRGVAGWLADRIEDNNYTRFLFHRGLLDLECGQRAELDQKQPGTTLYRKRQAVLGLIGSRCTETGTVQFPRSTITVNPESRAANTQEDYPLAEKTARIVSYTADSLGFSPDPPTYYGTLDFEGGGRLVTEFAEIGPDDAEVGREMRMVFRIKARDNARDFTKYFWKAVLAASGDA